MKMVCRPITSVSTACFGTVDITQFRDVIDTPQFQRTRYLNQLGEAHIVYPDAQHTRFGHLLGVLKYTERRLRRLLEWSKAGEIMATEEDRIHAVVYGLEHDIAHGPRSHITDPLVKVDHKERAVAIIRELDSAHRLMGVDTERIVRMIRGEDPLGALVTGGIVSTDKLAYLRQDALMTGVDGMLDEGPFLDNVYYIDQRVLVDAKIIGMVKALDAFYKLMYDRVYYRPAVVLSERYYQRMISHLLGQTNTEYEAEVTEAELVAMTDSDLDHHLWQAQNPIVRQQVIRYQRREQAYPALAFQVAPFDQHHWVGGHKMAYLAGSPKLLTSQRLKDPSLLYDLERTVEGLTGLPPQSVLIVPPTPAKRFMPQPVDFLTSNGPMSLEAMAPDWWAAEIAEAPRYACLYVGAYLENCPALVEPKTAQAVQDLLEEAA